MEDIRIRYDSIDVKGMKWGMFIVRQDVLMFLLKLMFLVVMFVVSAGRLLSVMV